MDQPRNPQAVKLAIRHYLEELRRNWKVSLPALLLPGVGTILVLYGPPLVVAQVLARVGSLTSSGSTNVIEPLDLAPYIALFAGVWFSGEIVWRLAEHFLIITNARGIRRLYARAIQELLAKDLVFFHDNFAGSLTKKTVGYAKNYEGFVDVFAFSISSNFLPIFFIIPVLWFFSPLLVFVLVGMTALTFALAVPLIRRRQKLVAAREAASNAVAGHVTDTFANIDAVRTFAQESFEAATNAQNVEDYVRKAERSWHYHNQKINVLISPLYVLINAAGLFIAVLTSRNGGVSLEAVFLTFSYYAGFTRVMWDFNRIFRNLENFVTEAAQFTELLLEKPGVTDPENPEAFRVTQGEVEFRNVRFRYRDAGNERLFDGFTLTIRSGERIGIVGHSGGGKTTVTRLLLRLMNIEGGEILIDGQNIARIMQKDLRAAIAYVPQDPVMFHRSLLDNIRYGRLDARDEEVEEAARLAHAAEFIEKLPKQYDTLIGERGVKLSGGQRQRVAIARAILKNAPLLVLDEATSALDSENEGLIQEGLSKLMEGRTTMVIAHRLSTVQKMHRIVVLESGKIAEEGSHKELLEKNGVYAHLWARQSGGFLEE